MLEKSLTSSEPAAQRRRQVGQGARYPAVIGQRVCISRRRDSVAQHPARTCWLCARNGITTRTTSPLRILLVAVAVGMIVLSASCRQVSGTGASSPSSPAPTPTRCKLTKALPGVLQRTGTGPPDPGYQWDVIRCPGLKRNAIGGILIQVIAGSGVPGLRSRTLPCPVTDLTTSCRNHAA